MQVESTNKFYVYQLSDPRTSIPFYIGKGHKNRAHQHIGEARRGSTRPVHKKIRSMSSAPVVDFLEENVSESQAYEFEEFAISEIGRRCDKSGPLLNLSCGGKGGTAGYSSPRTPEQEGKRIARLRSKEVRRKISRGVRNCTRIVTPEGRAAIIAAHRGKILSPETKQKISDSKTGKPGIPMTKRNRLRLIARNTGRKLSKETKRKISESVKANPLTVEQAAKQRQKVLCKVECPKCGKIGARSIMMRWHFENCRNGDSS